MYIRWQSHLLLMPQAQFGKLNRIAGHLKDCLFDGFFASTILVGCMYGIFTYIYQKSQLNVNVNIPYMDPMGKE